ncbi:hypothetical protein [Pseudoroseicyclus tamaricis]|uniref:Fucose permease n=1 Tax=Pseudoroseicyclus tamaricis TaxID=2705421 RepID=A0A6B2JLQ9_9RHOB|nr:hypothetical protein [Pseudoroseicyclus tamaricis]NDU99556.1 hypothetical protein [Pseudoroseicyclus tamaricis]
MTSHDSTPARLLVTGGIGFTLIGALPALYGLALPVWSEQHGPWGAGLVIGVHGLGCTLAVLAGLFGLLRLTLRLSFVALLAGTLGLALSPGWWGILCGALVAGIGFGGLSVVVNRRFLTEFGPRGPGMVGLVNAVFGLGAIAAPAALLLAGGRPGPVYLGLAAIALVTLPLVRPALRRPNAPTGVPPLHAGRLSVLCFIFASAVLESGLAGYGPTALLSLGMEASSVALATSGFFAAFLAGRLALYWVAQRTRPELVLAAGLFGTAAALGLASAGLTAPGFIAAGAAVGIQFPAFYVWATSVLGPDERLSSAPLIGGLAGSTLGPFALAPILGAWGGPLLFPVLAAVGLVAGLALLASLRRISRISAATLDKRAPA